MTAKLIFSAFLAAALVGSPTFAREPTVNSPQKPPVGEQIVGFAFDWDDNIFEMPTQILLFHKTTGAERGIGTAEFALIRADIGKPGTPWADFELRNSPKDGSLRNFGDEAADGIDHFQDDINKAMANKSRVWQGPVWKDFVAAMNSPETASHTWIITARLHKPQTIQKAIQGLVSKGLIKHAPPFANIWAVNEPGFNGAFQQVFRKEPPTGDAANPSARKAAVMEQVLDQVNQTPITPSATDVMPPSGKGKAKLHLWGFSDDDFGNFEKATKVLQQGVDHDRWSRVKITVFFTGTNVPGQKPHAVVLRRGAAPRPFTELGEWKSVLAHDGMLQTLTKHLH